MSHHYHELEYDVGKLLQETWNKYLFSLRFHNLTSTSTTDVRWCLYELFRRQWTDIYRQRLREANSEVL